MRSGPTPPPPRAVAKLITLPRRPGLAGPSSAAARPQSAASGTVRRRRAERQSAGSSLSIPRNCVDKRPERGPAGGSGQIFGNLFGKRFYPRCVSFARRIAFAQPLEAGAIAQDCFGDRRIQRFVCQEPAGGAAELIGDPAIQFDLQSGIDLAVQSIDTGLERRKPERPVAQDKAARHVRRGQAGNLAGAQHKDRPRQIDDGIDQHGGDDFAPEAVALRFFRKGGHRAWREITRQQGHEERIVGQGAG